MRRLGLGLLIGAAGAALFGKRHRVIGVVSRARTKTLHVADVSDEPRDQPAAVPPEPAEELELLSRAELYERARAAGIRRRSEMSKAELIAALRSR